MFELLSRERKKVIRSDYSLHLSIAFAWLLAIAGVVWVIVLMPSVYVSHLRTTTLEQTAASLQGTGEKTDNIEHVASIDAVRAVASIASSSPAHPTFIVDAVTELSGDLSISVIAADRIPDTKSYAVTISGVAPTRSDIVKFRERLEAEEWVSSAEVPFSSLVKEQDVPFSVSVRTIEVPYVKKLTQ
jgi:hypothetical protein